MRPLQPFSDSVTTTIVGTSPRPTERASGSIVAIAKSSESTMPAASSDHHGSRPISATSQLHRLHLRLRVAASQSVAGAVGTVPHESAQEAANSSVNSFSSSGGDAAHAVEQQCSLEGRGLVSMHSGTSARVDSHPRRLEPDDSTKGPPRKLSKLN